jgi:hypothetical protein
MLTSSLEHPAARLTPGPLPGGKSHSGASDDWSAVQASGVLQSRNCCDYPPSLISTSGQIDGSTLPAINELARRLGLTAQITDFAFDGLLDAQALNQVVSIAALSITPERLSQVISSLYMPVRWHPGIKMLRSFWRPLPTDRAAHCRPTDRYMKIG